MDNQEPATIRDYLELIRLPNVFTAMAGAAMGALFVREPVVSMDYCLLAFILLASSLLYFAGIVLNDVFDLEIDSRQRPERPLPSGYISVETARRLGWCLLVAGIGFGCAASMLTGDIRSGFVAALLAVCILLYDGLLKSTVLGPVVMGACRMLNVLLGMSIGGLPFAAENWTVAGAIGLYIVGVTWFSRTETERSSRWSLSFATLAMLCSIALLGVLPMVSDRLILPLQMEPMRWYLAMFVLGILVCWRCLGAIVVPSPARVQATVGQSILSLIIIDATICYAVCDWFWAVMVLLLILPAMILRNWINIT